MKKYKFGYNTENRGQYTYFCILANDMYQALRDAKSLVKYNSVVIFPL